MLRRLLRSAGDAGSLGTEVWIFGSALSSPSPEDVDLLVIYDPESMNHDDANKLRDELARAVEATSNLPADIRLLSQREARQTAFLDRVDAIRIT